MELTDQNESVFKRSLLVLTKVSRKISALLEDHKLFKTFVFNNKEHQRTLLGHAKKLCAIMRERS